MNDPLAIARRLVELGVPVFRAFPCTGEQCDYPARTHSGAWHLPTGWQTTYPNHYDAIEMWRPGQALCAVMGTVFDTIDVDPRNGGSVAPISTIRSYGEQRTPSGGVHRLIKALGVGKRSTHHHGLPGIDLQGGVPNTTDHRGFIFIAPTVARSKVDGSQRAYVWNIEPSMPLNDDTSGRWLAAVIHARENARVNVRVQDRVRSDIDPTERARLDNYVDTAIKRGIDDYRNAKPGDGERAALDILCRIWAFDNTPWVDWPDSAVRDGYVNVWLEAAQQRLDRHPAGGGQTPQDCERLIRQSQKIVERKDETAAYPEAREVKAGSVFDRARSGINDRQAMPGKARELPDLPPGQVVLRRASSFDPKRVQWLWHDRIPLGEITLVAGREGVGKSTYLADLAAKITRGEALGEFTGQPRGVLYIAGEDSWHHTIVPRMIAAGADLDLIYHVASQEDRGLVLPADVDSLAEAALGVNAAAIMCDPIISLIDDRLSTDRARELRMALEPLRRSAEVSRTSLVALVHFNKNDGDVLTKIAGSRGWVEVARAVIGLARDEEEGHCVLSQIKNNLGKLDLSHWTYTIESFQFEFKGERIETGRLMWGGKTERGISDLLSKKGPGRPQAQRHQAIVQYVATLDEPASIATIGQHFPEIRYETLGKILARAAENHELRRHLPGVYGP